MARIIDDANKRGDGISRGTSDSSSILTGVSRSVSGTAVLSSFLVVSLSFSDSGDEKRAVDDCDNELLAHKAPRLRGDDDTAKALLLL